MGGTGFGRDWTVEVLAAEPLIAPARQYVWPMRIAGEEDALARGALRLMVRPSGGGSFLVTCALGFKSAEVPTGAWGCPDAGEICAVAGGYAYLAKVGTPESCVLLEMKPVVEVVECVEAGLLVFVGFDRLLGWGRDGQAWVTERVSWEGVRIVGVDGGELRGYGWDLMADREVEFGVELATGKVRGGVFAEKGR